MQHENLPKTLIERVRRRGDVVSMDCRWNYRSLQVREAGAPEFLHAALNDQQMPATAQKRPRINTTKIERDLIY